jgi:hypothetical protein
VLICAWFLKVVLFRSFENSNCEDYITEKLFVNGLSRNVVPIVVSSLSLKSMQFEHSTFSLVRDPTITRKARQRKATSTSTTLSQSKLWRNSSTKSTRTINSTTHTSNGKEPPRQSTPFSGVEFVPCCMTKVRLKDQGGRKTSANGGMEREFVRGSHGGKSK